MTIEKTKLFRSFERSRREHTYLPVISPFGLGKHNSPIAISDDGKYGAWQQMSTRSQLVLTALDDKRTPTVLKSWMVGTKITALCMTTRDAEMLAYHCINSSTINIQKTSSSISSYDDKYCISRLKFGKLMNCCDDDDMPKRNRRSPRCHSLAFTRDGRNLISGHERGAIIMWDVENTCALEQFNVSGFEILGVVPHPMNDGIFFSGEISGGIHIHKFDMGEHYYKMADCKHSLPSRFRRNPNTRKREPVDREKNFKYALYDHKRNARNGHTCFTLNVNRQLEQLNNFGTVEFINCIDVSYDGKYLVVGGSAGFIALYNIVSPLESESHCDISSSANWKLELDKIVNYIAVCHSITSVQFSRRGDHILVASEDDIIRIVSRRTGKLQHEIYYRSLSQRVPRAQSAGFQTVLSKQKQSEESHDIVVEGVGMEHMVFSNDVQMMTRDSKGIVLPWDLSNQLGYLSTDEKRMFCIVMISIGRNKRKLSRFVIKDLIKVNRKFL